MEPCQVYVSFNQYESEPPIPVSLYLVFPDGRSHTVYNALDTSELLAKYGDKLSPRAYKEFKSGSLFDYPPLQQQNAVCRHPGYF